MQKVGNGYINEFMKVSTDSAILHLICPAADAVEPRGMPIVACSITAPTNAGKMS